MAESYFGTHLCKLTTVSGTVGGQLRQVSLYLHFNKNSMVLEAHAFYMQWETELLCLCIHIHSRGVATIQ